MLVKQTFNKGLWPPSLLRKAVRFTGSNLMFNCVSTSLHQSIKIVMSWSKICTLRPVVSREWICLPGMEQTTDKAVIFAHVLTQNSGGDTYMLSVTTANKPVTHWCSNIITNPVKYYTSSNMDLKNYSI